MSYRVPPILAVVLATALLAGPSTASAKNEDWVDTQGNKFRGEPSEVIGPFAVFRTSGTSGRKVLFRQLAPADCVRFYEAVKVRPPRADDWAKAKGLITAEVFDRVERVDAGKLVAADLRGRPEPQFIVLVFGTHNNSESWQMVDAVLEQYPKLRPRFGGQVEVLFFGMRHSEAEGKRMAQDKQMPWLVARLKNAHDMEMVTRFLPGEPPLLVVVTREGIPLFSCNFETKEKVAKTLGDFTSFLEWIQPTNPRAAPDRLQYLRAVQPVAYRTGRCGPVLVIDPFNAAALAKLGVISFDATLSVAADGSITSVDLKEGGKLPEGMVDAVTNGLRQAMIVPAVENGHKIEGTCEYHFQAPQ